MLNFKLWHDFKCIVEFITGVHSMNEAVVPFAAIENAMETTKFKDWLASLGIMEPLQKPKEGGVGVAFFTGDYVVKFTTDRNEANAAAIVKGYDSPNLAKVVDVKLVSHHPDSTNKLKPVYAIVQEKLNTDPVTKKHRVAGQTIYDYLDHNPGFIKADIKTIMPAVLNYLPKNYKKDNIIIEIIQKMLERIKKIQDDTGFLTQDTHGANLAFKGREPAFFDLGRSSIDFENPRTSGVRVKNL